jgi:hypothetical protein
MPVDSVCTATQTGWPVPLKPWIRAIANETHTLKTNALLRRPVMMRLPPQPEPSDSGPHISQFDLNALAFADLIERTVGSPKLLPDSPPPSEPPEELPLYSTIRCICGNNENAGELVSCHDCHCYLHAACIDRQSKRGPNFRCPFCRLQLDGVDPFRELTTLVDSMASELRSVHGLISEAASLEAQIANLNGGGIGMPEYPMIGMRSQRGNVAQLRSALARIIQEVIQHINSIAGQ